MDCTLKIELVLLDCLSGPKQLSPKSFLLGSKLGMLEKCWDRPFKCLSLSLQGFRVAYRLEKETGDVLTIGDLENTYIKCMSCNWNVFFLKIFHTVLGL